MRTLGVRRWTSDITVEFNSVIKDSHSEQGEILAGTETEPNIIYWHDASCFDVWADYPNRRGYGGSYETENEAFDVFANIAAKNVEFFTNPEYNELLSSIWST